MNSSEPRVEYDANGSTLAPNTSSRSTATPAMTPSALAHVTVWAPRVMSPAAYTPGTVVRCVASVRMIVPSGRSSVAQPRCDAMSLLR